MIEVVDTHWLWTGYAVPARTRKRLNTLRGATQRGPYKPDPDTGDYQLYQEFQTRSHPRTTYKGRSVSAARMEMAKHLDRPMEDVPRLRNICGHELCVRPDHYVLRYGDQWVTPDQFLEGVPITLVELLASDHSSYLPPDTLSKLFGGRPLSLETYQAFQASEDDLYADLQIA